MSFYEKYCLHHVLDCACSLQPVRKQREKVVPHATGRVLEIGMGSGLNLPFYNQDAVEFIWGLEPSEQMRRKAQKNLDRSPLEVKWLGLPSEQIPLEDDQADTVVLTYTLCTIPDWQSALSEMRRVLKPDGKLLFCEHGRAPDTRILTWQKRLNPIWRRIAGGCNLNRPIAEMIAQNGFKIETLNEGYIPGPKFAGYNYWGTAVTA
jgi:ubiquinone/menaquinone biosynthesis C-methylase UbiE